MAPNGRIRRRDFYQSQDFQGNNPQRSQPPSHQLQPNTPAHAFSGPGPSGSGQAGIAPSGNNYWSRSYPPAHQPPVQNYSSDLSSLNNLPQAVYVQSGSPQGQQVSSAQGFDPLGSIPTGIENHQNTGFYNQPQYSIATVQSVNSVHGDASNGPAVQMPPQAR